MFLSQLVLNSSFGNDLLPFSPLQQGKYVKVGKMSEEKCMYKDEKKRRGMEKQMKLCVKFVRVKYSEDMLPSLLHRSANKQ